MGKMLGLSLILLRHVLRVLTLRRWHDYRWRYGGGHGSHLYYKCEVCEKWVVDKAPRTQFHNVILFNAQHHDLVPVRRRLHGGRRGRLDVHPVAWFLRARPVYAVVRRGGRTVFLR